MYIQGKSCSIHTTGIYSTTYFPPLRSMTDCIQSYWLSCKHFREARWPKRFTTLSNGQGSADPAVGISSYFKRDSFPPEKAVWTEGFFWRIHWHGLTQVGQYQLCWRCQSSYNHTTCGFTTLKAYLTNPPTTRTVGFIRRIDLRVMHNKLHQAHDALISSSAPISSIMHDCPRYPKRSIPNYCIRMNGS